MEGITSDFNFKIMFNPLGTRDLKFYQSQARDWALFGDFLFFLIKPVFYL